MSTQETCKVVISDIENNKIRTVQITTSVTLLPFMLLA